MKQIDKDSLAEIEFVLDWQSNEGRHTDSSVKLVNFWRDLLPDAVAEGLMGACSGERKSFRLKPQDGLGPADPGLSCRLARHRFDETMAEPRYGRFYPKGILRDFYHVFPQNVRPIRCTGVDPEQVEVDLNHPLAACGLELTAVIHDIMEKPFDRGGQSRDMIAEAAEGPGMQARCNGRPTDFGGPDAYRRQDETNDARFYESPRLVTHMDDRALAEISRLYGRFAEPGMAVLDLMSSWRSHVPEGADPERLVGLGMNTAEMADNPQLSEYLVHDINADPWLPFPDATFDLVICTASVEYITRPDAVFRESARVLKPGGALVHTFSNRWFPPKVVNVWTGLHEFERMGLVLEYFTRSGCFTDLGTFSSRGWDRPKTDRHYPKFTQSDPVYAVWGRKTG